MPTTPPEYWNVGALNTAPKPAPGVGCSAKLVVGIGPWPASSWTRPSPPPPAAPAMQPMLPCEGRSRPGPSTEMIDAVVIVSVEKVWIQTSPPAPDPPPPVNVCAVVFAPVKPSARILPGVAALPCAYGPTQEIRRPPPPPPPPPPWSSA